MVPTLTCDRTLPMFGLSVRSPSSVADATCLPVCWSVCPNGHRGLLSNEKKIRCKLLTKMLMSYLAQWNESPGYGYGWPFDHQYPPSGPTDSGAYSRR